MTVCIAAIYNNNAIIGASDRMITAGDIEFEPTMPKIIPVTSSIAVMTAGDANVQTQLYSEVSSIINSRISSNPNKWISVSEVANLYSENYHKLKTDLAEKEILSPFRLNSESFIKRQKEMSPEFIERIAYKLEGFQIEDKDIATIITGIDETGPHIFVVGNSEISWNDRIGFAAVGIGKFHAEAHFELSGHTPFSEEAKTLLTVHQAKKKSEVSPGVGQGTDMFVIGPGLGSFKWLIPTADLNKDIVKDLDDYYTNYKQQILDLDKKTEDNIRQYLKDLFSQPLKKQEDQQSPSSKHSPSRPSTKPRQKDTKKDKLKKK